MQAHPDVSVAVTLAGDGVAFTSRVPGMSTGPYQGLNLSLEVGDDVDAVMANRRIVSDHLGIDQRWTTVKQVHGIGVHRVGNGEVPSPEADVIVAETSAVIAVMVADCVPIAMEGPNGFAVVHAGWRGLCSGVVDVAIDALSASRAWVGPCIGSCHYVVGPEVPRAFDLRYPHLGDMAVTKGGRLSFDLAGAVRAVIEHRSVRVEHMSDRCTVCEDGLYSYRRSGTTGRQAVLMWR